MHEEFTNVPFTFGTIILKTDFVNRQKEIKLLRQCFLSGTNVILISPRRWGNLPWWKRLLNHLKMIKH